MNGYPESLPKFNHFIFWPKYHKVYVISDGSRGQYSQSFIHTVISASPWLVQNKTFPIMKPFST